MERHNNTLLRPEHLMAAGQEMETLQAFLADCIIDGFTERGYRQRCIFDDIKRNPEKVKRMTQCLTS